MGSIRRGDTIKWRINGIQTARKTGPNTYNTDYRFTKKFVGLRKVGR
jgi:hypothetical protein